MARHKHADVIHAWAEGATIQYWLGDGWKDCLRMPSFCDGDEYRVKPKVLKHRAYLYKSAPDKYRIQHLYESHEPRDVSFQAGFIRWLDEDWVEVEL